jgi:DNA-binding transcriptional LysR family regulator
MPELRQLRYLLALSECGTFARAAEQEHITQSALSQQVARLEREWGVLLFDRTPRGTRPTAAGARLLPQVRSLLSGSTALEAPAAALATGATGELVLGSPTYAVRSRSRQLVLAAFAEGHPGVALGFRNAWMFDRPAPGSSPRAVGDGRRRPGRARGARRPADLR